MGERRDINENKTNEILNVIPQWRDSDMGSREKEESRNTKRDEGIQEAERNDEHDTKKKGYGSCKNA